MKLSTTLAWAGLTSLVTALSPAEWRNQSIYFIMTDRFARTDGSTDSPCNTSAPIQYCGGTWQGIIDNLDYIQGMGFSAIWITPVGHNIQTTPAYHGYWQDDLYDVNPQWGTSDDLVALSNALHERGMYLMLDVVTNHFAFTGPANETDYSEFTPFNDEEYFHSPQRINYEINNQTLVEVGWLVVDVYEPIPVVLPDVNTSRSDVREIYYDWIEDLVANYSVDGIRVDTVKHVELDFWREFNDRAGVFAIGEVWETEDIEHLCNYQGVLDGLLNYGPYNEIKAGFNDSTGSLYAVADKMLQVAEYCNDTSLLGTFMENHDNPRFPNMSTDIVNARNAISFTMLADGIPIIYQGQEQHYSGGQDPHNREAVWLSGFDTTSNLYQLITRLNQIRNVAIAQDGEEYLTSIQQPIFVDPNTLVVRKGRDRASVLGVYTNVGADGEDYTITIPGMNLGYSVGEELFEAISCSAVTVGENGSLEVTITEGEPQIFYPAALVAGLCDE